ncbi:hypothetical protein KBY97_01805 [Synechococcus sp. ATX 2A4]|uniref:hypothetical protein n=1 Tax=Synechococcus sp. ATX 2A4 TaxID=2823727 RepID=UPI0020CC7B5D|nr:hypothetical protein [Synechococcus sp. ATX 2A4]MCP9883864.1 hypothetical protein [Synechococcus sp. ATX 2A4]
MTSPLPSPAVGIRLRLARRNLERLDALTRAWGMPHRGEALDHLLEQLWEDTNVPVSVGCAAATAPAQAAVASRQVSVQCSGPGGIGWLRALFTKRR